jgi:hypothetical protein
VLTVQQEQQAQLVLQELLVQQVQQALLVLA